VKRRDAKAVERITDSKSFERASFVVDASPP